jgi:hypothetical protein
MLRSISRRADGSRAGDRSSPGLAAKPRYVGASMAGEVISLGCFGPTAPASFGPTCSDPCARPDAGFRFNWPRSSSLSVALAQPAPEWARIDRCGRSAAGLSGGSPPGSSGSAGRSGESAGRVWRWRPAVEPIVRRQSARSIVVDPTCTDGIDAGVEPREVGVRAVGPDEAGVVGPERPGETLASYFGRRRRGEAPAPAATHLPMVEKKTDNLLCRWHPTNVPHSCEG